VKMLILPIAAIKVVSPESSECYVYCTFVGLLYLALNLIMCVTKIAEGSQWLFLFIVIVSHFILKFTGAESGHCSKRTQPSFVRFVAVDLVVESKPPV
jgi:hypothetical protein